MRICFIGHRKVENSDEIIKRLYSVISTLITQGADAFLFGSRSDFNILCWKVVTELKQQFPHIRRISYPTPHEVTFTSEEKRNLYQELTAKITGQKVDFAVFESAVTSPKYTQANKNTYILRNQEMIDACDICIFYFNKDYLPPRRKQSKRSVIEYQPNSGTAVAYAYAKRKKKKIINIFEYTEINL